MRKRNQAVIFILFVWAIVGSIVFLSTKYPILSVLASIFFAALITYLYIKLMKKNFFLTTLTVDTSPIQTLSSDAMSAKQSAVPAQSYNDLPVLPDKHFFEAILNKSISHARRHKKIMALLAIKVEINTPSHSVDTHIVNELLNHIGARFSSSIRNEDIVAHLESDEFTVSLYDIGKPKFASAVAEKILRACQTPIKIGQHEFIITPSIGVSTYPIDGTTLEDLMKNARSAMMNVKKSGGNQYQFFSPKLDIEAHDFIRLEADLRKAIELGQLELYYQPKMHIKNGAINGMEALMRWNHPVHGLISPTTFIPLAEETGLIMLLSEWAILEACKINKHWQDEGYEHVTMSLNLSPKQFNHPDIIDLISKALQQSELNPKYLELEISEATIMEDMDTALNIFEKIKALDVQLSIDHFGTGYTSISHLKKFPINAVKIDSSYIKGIPLNPNDMAITSAFIGLIHNLGFEVIAEGVETSDQVQYLTEQQCDMVQGYFLSHPEPAEKVVKQFTKLMDRVLY